MAEKTLFIVCMRMAIMSEFVFTVPIEGTSQSYTNASSSTSTPEAKTRPYRKACVHCHDRKVKCDKKSPCSNCQRFHLECTFPSPFRHSSRQTKDKHVSGNKDANEDILKRIKKIESAMQDLNALKKDVLRSRKRRKEQSSEDSEEDGSLSAGGEDHGHGNSGVTDSLDHAVGKLIIEEGKSRYISGGFWSGLEEEVC